MAINSMSGDELFEVGIDEAKRLLKIIDEERKAIGPPPERHIGREAIIGNALHGLGDLISFFEDQYKKAKV